MKGTETLYVPTRVAWRAWRAVNHESASEVWFVFYRNGTGYPSVSYAEAVEEALCVGWIDGVRRKLDAERYANRFTPRRPASSYSQVNRERLARLHAQGRLHASVEAIYDEVRPEAFQIPDEILVAGGAWASFVGTSPSYQRIRASHVAAAQSQPAEFEKRLARLVGARAAGQLYPC